MSTPRTSSRRVLMSVHVMVHGYCTSPPHPISTSTGTRCSSLSAEPVAGAAAAALCLVQHLLHLAGGGLRIRGAVDRDVHRDGSAASADGGRPPEDRPRAGDPPGDRSESAVQGGHAVD